MKDTSWKLYWCTTDDHDEDWFVVARNAREARAFFEDYEDYDPGDAHAKLLRTVPPSCAVKQAGWASHTVLWKCGKFLRTETPRVVEIGGVIFEEGRLEHQIRRIDDDMAESVGQPRMNGTVPLSAN